MEEGFVLKKSLDFPPYVGDVAVGWDAFGQPGAYGYSKFNGNKFIDNVHSGQYSQEITFDFVDATAGIYRTVEVIAGHRYTIEAWAKHTWSVSPVELALGVDLGGGTNFQAPNVQWFPWDAQGDEVWLRTAVTVQATGSTMTIFLRGHHPMAERGGATIFDDVRVHDHGP